MTGVTHRKRRITQETLDRRMRQKAQRTLSDLWVKADNAAKMQMASQILHIKLHPTKQKTIEQMVEEALMKDQRYIELLTAEKRLEVQNKPEKTPQQELEDYITMMALEQIRSNSALAADAVQREATSIVGASAPCDPIASIDSALSTIDRLSRALKLLKERRDQQQYRPTRRAPPTDDLILRSAEHAETEVAQDGDPTQVDHQ